MAILLGAAHLIQATAERIPEGHTVRLLFQPAEEGQGLNKRGGIGGAPEMIDDGCLEGVDEVRFLLAPSLFFIWKTLVFIERCVGECTIVLVRSWEPLYPQNHVGRRW